MPRTKNKSVSTDKPRLILTDNDNSDSDTVQKGMQRLSCLLIQKCIDRVDQGDPLLDSEGFERLQKHLEEI